MLPPVSGEHPNPKKVAIKKDNQKDYQKKGYKYLGQKTPDLDNLQPVKKVKTTRKTKKTKPIIQVTKVQEVKDFITNIKENKMNLKQIYRNIKEQQEKKQILLDDLDKDVCENCGQDIHEGDCNECNEDEEIEEQNVTSAIAGYNGPISSKKKMIFPTSRK